LLSIDLGYGYVKAVKDGERVMFPSVTAPAQESIADYGKSLDYLLEYRNKDETAKRRFFVGELAARGSLVPEASLDSTRFTRQGSVVMVLTAAYLLGCEDQTLLLGLPLAYYKNQYKDVKSVFQRISAYVSVNKGPEKYISFPEIYVFPQGAGAVYAQENLPEKGLVGLLDIGYHTTECILFECTPESVEPLNSYNLTVEIGVSTALKFFSERVGQMTGEPISLIDAQYLWKKKRFSFKGVPIDTSAVIDEAKKAAVASLAGAVKSAWLEKANRLDDLILSGGGSVEFYDDLRRVFPIARLGKEPQFANALGYLELIEDK